MNKIKQEEPSLDFKRAWQSARHHIQQQGQGGVGWIRSNLDPPVAEHLSFLVGNKLFFIFVDAAEFSYEMGKNLFLKASKEAAAIPCVMPMTEHLSGSQPSVHGWGLLHAETHKEVNPLELITDELIEISDWELHDFAIKVVKDSLEKEGKNVFSAQSSLHINPSIWFEESGIRYWVVVRAVRYPEKEATIPSNIMDIKAGCSHKGETGYFASVSVANAEDPFDPMAKNNGNFFPLYRGYGVSVIYKGLIDV